MESSKFPKRRSARENDLVMFCRQPRTTADYELCIMNYALRITHSVLRHNDIADKLPHESPGGILPAVPKERTSAGISKRTN